MSTGSKQFTFYSQSQSNQINPSSKFSTNQLLNSTPAYVSPHRSSSVPIKQQPQSIHDYRTYQIGDSSKRRHRIFDENLSFTQQNTSPQKKKRKSIFQTDSKKKQLKVQGGITDNTKLKVDVCLEDTIKSPFEYKQLIEKKLAERALSNGVHTQNGLKERMVIKQREVRLLKLQIERFRRCQILNKQNEELYKRLTIKLKQSANQSFIPSSKKEASQLSQPFTPIHSLTEIRFAPEAETTKKQQQPQSRMHVYQPRNTEPLKTIPENEENHLYTQAKVDTQAVEQAKQLKATLKPKEDRSKRSPPKCFNIEREKDPVYLTIQQKLNEHTAGYRKNINQVPLNRRLQEMNRTLERNVDSTSKRVNSRPHSQSSQKAKRDYSLYKSHYYVMMQ